MAFVPTAANLEDAVRLRKFNGVIPIVSHPAQLVGLGNELHQRFNAGDMTIPMDTYITNLSEVVIPIQVHEDIAKVEVSVLARPTAAGLQTISFTSNGDATGITLSFSNFFNGAPDTLANAFWASGGPHDGDVTKSEARALIVTADAQNLDEITYVGNANVRVYAFRFRHIAPRTL